ncbi:MAG: heme-binding protein [Pseudomonadota bacterium]
MTLRISLAAACVAVITPAVAQDTTQRLNEVAAQEIIEGCRAFADENELTIAITIVDDRTQLVAYRRMDGLRQGPAELAGKKADYAARWGAATEGLAEAVQEGRLGWALTSQGTPIAGGVPIYSQDDVLLGGVGVSGASAEDDATCARAGIARAGLKDSRS